MLQIEFHFQKTAKVTLTADSSSSPQPVTRAVSSTTSGPPKLVVKPKIYNSKAASPRPVATAKLNAPVDNGIDSGEEEYNGPLISKRSV